MGVIVAPPGGPAPDMALYSYEYTCPAGVQREAGCRQLQYEYSTTSHTRTVRVQIPDEAGQSEYSYSYEYAEKKNKPKTKQTKVRGKRSLKLLKFQKSEPISDVISPVRFIHKKR